MLLRPVTSTEALEKSASTHVVVLGNEKGGSGKSTLAMHIAVALMKAGQRIATIDLDSRQRSLTHYIENRRSWAKRTKLNLELPVHFCVAQGDGIKLDQNEEIEFSGFAAAVTAVQHTHDFVVVDTPGADTYLTRLAHSMADTLITPLNDSFVDFDVLGHVDPMTFAVTGSSHYSEMVREARRQRRAVDGNMIDWVLVRNRLSMLGSRNKRLVAGGLNELAQKIGARSIDGFVERMIYREFFPRGLTAIDTIDEAALGTRPSSRQANSHHASALGEVQTVLAALRLPLDARGKQHAADRAEWFATADSPIVLDDILAA